MSLLMLVPLYVPDTIGPGLDRLPPQDQVRGAWLPAVLVLAGLPHVLLVAVAEREEQPGATVLLAGCGVDGARAGRGAPAHGRAGDPAPLRRGRAGGGEPAASCWPSSCSAPTRIVTGWRRNCTSRPCRPTPSFVSFMQVQAGGAAGRRGVGGRVGARCATTCAARPSRCASSCWRCVRSRSTGPRSTSLGTPINAYVDGLYRDRPPPVPTSRWPTTSCSTGRPRPWSCGSCRRPCATCGATAGPGRIDVTVRGDGAAVEVCVTDDGVGFDPGAVLFESGIAAMRWFAALGQGSLGHREPPRAGHAGRGPARRCPVGARCGGQRRRRRMGAGLAVGRAACVTRTAAGALGRVSRRSVRSRTRR